MIKKLFLATNNKNKIKEFEDIFRVNNFNIEIVTPENFKNIKEPDETGLSFEENSKLKTKYYFDKVHLPTLADDSGLVIDFFINFPGINSKRWLSKMENYRKNEMLLKIMKPIKDRHAHYECCLTYINEFGKISKFNGEMTGVIGNEASGYGFGFDPVFYIPEFKKSVANLGPDFKQKCSHRANATKQFLEYLKKCDDELEDKTAEELAIIKANADAVEATSSFLNISEEQAIICLKYDDDIAADIRKELEKRRKAIFK